MLIQRLEKWLGDGDKNDGKSNVTLNSILKTHISMIESKILKREEQ